MTTNEAIEKIADDLDVQFLYLLGFYYESGLEYLEQHRQRMRSEFYFDAQFGKLFSIGALRNVDESTYRLIEESKWFWLWWTYMFAVTYRLHRPKDTTEFSIRLTFVNDLIPNEILIKIIGHEKKNNTNGSKAANCRPAYAAIEL